MFEHRAWMRERWLKAVTYRKEAEKYALWAEKGIQTDLDRDTHLALAILYEGLANDAAEDYRYVKRGEYRKEADAALRKDSMKAAREVFGESYQPTLPSAGP
jgi:hypothetical protein